jgi:diacylglycerol kinase family enzyme
MGGIAVILNAASGSGAAAKIAHIGQLLAGSAREGTITRVAHGGGVAAAAKRAMEGGSEALVAAGGDGTVNAVASALVGTQIPLGILPLGTLNHFAKDAGIPLDLDEAMRVILAGRARAVDVGEVNGRIFLNNASLGVYPRIVQLRESYRKKGLGKWLAGLWASLAVLRRHPFMTVNIRTQDQNILRRSPAVFVGNNAYETAGFSLGSRKALDQGVLALYVMNAGARVGLLRLGWQLWWMGAERVQELDCLLTSEAFVETARGAVRAGLDGELVELKTPLRCRSRPGALRVLVP